MYINFKQLAKYNLDMTDLGALLAIKQKDWEIFAERVFQSHQDNIIQKLLDSKLIQPLKSKSGYQLSNLGKSALKSLEIANLDDSHKEQFQKLVEAYQAVGQEAKLGNLKKGLQYFVDFMSQSDVEFDVILNVVEDYLQENLREPMYLRKLETLIFKPSNVYSTKFKLEESKLYQLIKAKQ